MCRGQTMMARAVLFLCVCSAIAFYAAADAALKNIGMNWGTLASHQLPGSKVVEMLKNNGINKVKLFDADAKTTSALEGSNMEVMVAVPNVMLTTVGAANNNANDWVAENITQYMRKDGVNIKYVAVGNEPYLKSYNGSFNKPLLPAVKAIQNALNKAGYGNKIKVVVPMNADVYDSSSTLPSGGAFRGDIKNDMKGILQFLNEHKCPFVVNIYPFLSLYEDDNFPLDFAFFDDHGKTSKDDGGYKYTNVLDANYDTLLHALKGAGYEDMKIIIGEIGWPTDAHKYATNKYAQKFYQGLFKRLGSNKGSPLRPEDPYEIYLFGLFDEDQKSILPGHFERHWGIFKFDGSPKFPVDFSGRNANKWPIGVKGVDHLESRWCIFDKNMVSSQDKFVKNLVDKACQDSDCTPMLSGSCAAMNNDTKASYAFNAHYQFKDQDSKACDFEGLGHITRDNPSKGDCVFPIMIESVGVRLMGYGAATFTAMLFTLFTLLL